MINRIIVLCGLFVMVILTANTQIIQQKRKHGNEFIETKNAIDLHDRIIPFEEKEWMKYSNNITRTGFFPKKDQFEERLTNQKYISSTKEDESCPIVLDTILTFSFSSISDSMQSNLTKYSYDQNMNRILETHYTWSPSPRHRCNPG